MKLKTIHELDFAAQRAIIGGTSFEPCGCEASCMCECEEEELSRAIAKDNHYRILERVFKVKTEIINS